MSDMMTFGSTLYRTGRELMIKCQVLFTQDRLGIPAMLVFFRPTNSIAQTSWNIATKFIAVY